jgi:hypothetical protein
MLEINIFLFIYIICSLPKEGYVLCRDLVFINNIFAVKKKILCYVYVLLLGKNELPTEIRKRKKWNSSLIPMTETYTKNSL